MSYKALLIGTSSYARLPPVPEQYQELQVIHDALISSTGTPFQANNVLAEMNPRRTEIEGRLRDFLSDADRTDTLFVYLTGQAIVERDELQLLFIDDDYTRTSSGRMSAGKISDLLKSTQAGAVLLILNTSFAGSFALPDSPRLKDSATSYYFIGSVGPTEQAYGYSSFSRVLANALERSFASESRIDPEALFSVLTERLAPEGIHPFFAVRGMNALSPPGDMPRSELKSIFVSYAHEDARWLKKLRPHLESLVQDIAEIKYWDDTDIRPGDDWRKEIREQLGGAQAALLLISADFLASEFIRNNELPDLLLQAEVRKTRLFCVIIRPCRFDKVTILSRFQAVNGPDRTLSEMRPAEQERTFLRLTDQLEQALR